MVINITPFLPCSPYKVVALKPFKTLTSEMLFGSKSKSLLAELFPDSEVEKVLVSLVEFENGTPSTIIKG